jgi:hypothetical protein
MQWASSLRWKRIRIGIMMISVMIYFVLRKKVIFIPVIDGEAGEGVVEKAVRVQVGSTEFKVLLRFI